MREEDVENYGNNARYRGWGRRVGWEDNRGRDKKRGRRGLGEGTAKNVRENETIIGAKRIEIKEEN